MIKYAINNKTIAQLICIVRRILVASKFMTGISNHNKRNVPTSLSNDLSLVGAVLQLIVALLVLVGMVLLWI